MPPPKRVLIVDDQNSSRALLRDVLSMEGYDVLEAENGQEGVACARESGPDLILLDIMMPVMTGLEALAAIRADARIRHIPIILCTAQGRVSDVERGLEAGADDYVVKPIDLHKMLVKVARLLEKPAA